jgi:YidC/Oxa1 family membrane protein insertase
VRLNNFLKSSGALVVYSEGVAYRPFLDPIVEEYAARGHAVAYVTSEKLDFRSAWVSPNIKNFYVGSGVKRIWFFQTLSAKVILMTMPDLATFHIKRSVNPVHYVYTQHSLNSLHMVYREGAFDAYDTIFAAGPHHAEEVRKLEHLRGTKIKNIVNQGYVLLDEQRKWALKSSVSDSQVEKAKERPITVLVAPSWGPQGLLENYAQETILPLLQAGMQVILRPHIRTLQLDGHRLESIIRPLRANPLFSVDLEPQAIGSFVRADVMVSAWSGAAFEFALSFRRPVVSVDVPRKIFNEHYTQVDSDPIEIAARDKLGITIDPKELSKLPILVKRLYLERDYWEHKLGDLTSGLVYNFGNAASSAASALERLMESQVDLKT